MAARFIFFNFRKAFCYSVTRQSILLFCNFWQRAQLFSNLATRFVNCNYINAFCYSVTMISRSVTL